MDKFGLKATVRDFLHDPDGDRYDDNTIFTLFDEALNEIATNTLFFRKHTDSLTTLNLYPNGNVKLPDDFVHLIEVYYNACKLEIVNEECPCSICPQGIPIKVFTDTNNSNYIRLYPRPDTTKEIEIPLTSANGSITFMNAEDIDTLCQLGYDISEVLDSVGELTNFGVATGITVPYSYIRIVYAYRPNIDDEIVWLNTDVVKAIRHYTLHALYSQDKESINLGLGDREYKLYQQTLQGILKRRKKDFANKIYNLRGYKNVWSRLK